MKTYFKVFLAFIVVFSISQNVWGETKTTYQLEELKWLSGSWLDHPKQNKVFETIWSPIRGDAMVGTTRVVWQGQLAYYEMLTMRQEATGIYYRFDYYDKKSGFKLTDTNRFKLTRLSHQKAVFEHVTSKDELTLEINRDGRLQGAWLDKSKPGSKPKTGYRLKKLTENEIK